MDIVPKMETHSSLHIHQGTKICSNAGGSYLKQLALSRNWKDGSSLQRLAIAKELRAAASSKEGGALQDSIIIPHITQYLPFLPLEREQVSFSNSSSFNLATTVQTSQSREKMGGGQNHGNYIYETIYKGVGMYRCGDVGQTTGPPALHSSEGEDSGRDIFHQRRGGTRVCRRWMSPGQRQGKLCPFLPLSFQPCAHGAFQARR